jgi:glycosyltransferase involved in cell wall biosynthesis
MTNNVVSIVMPMYNTAAYVSQAIESVLRQDYPHFELVIVDDGSTDGGQEVVNRYSDPRIRLIRTENGGPSAARNRGIEESRGAYITFLDSDDLLLPISLSSRLTGLQHTHAEVAFSKNFLTINISSDIGSTALGSEHCANPSRTVWMAKDLIPMLLDRTFFTFSIWSFMIDRKLFQRIKGFNPLIKIFEDVEFISRLLPATHKVVETSAPFYVYRRRHHSSSAINSRWKAAEALRMLRQWHQNLAPYLVGHEERIEQDIFTYCVQAYPYWTREHSRAMEEARRRRGDKPFDLTCVGGRKAQTVARLLGWRAGRLVTFASTCLKQNVFEPLRKGNLW